MLSVNSMLSNRCNSPPKSSHRSPTLRLEIWNDPCEHLRQLIARHIFKNFERRPRAGAGFTAYVDIHSIDDLSIDSDVLSNEPDVGHGMVAAAGGTTRPMNRDRLCPVHVPFQVAAGFECQFLGLDKSEMAIIDAGAAHEPAHYLGRVIPEFLQERLFGQG